MGLRNLFKPAYRSKDPEVRLKAVEQTDNQNLLAELAMTDNSPRVRKAAVVKVHDQELLVKIALDGCEIDARVAAVERIESQEKLAAIIKARRNYELMGACFARITNRDILNKIANDSEYNRSARRIAIENFADESYLDDVRQSPRSGSEPKSPREIAALMKKYGGEKLARTLGKFKGSRNAILALGQITKCGGEPAVIAVEYLAATLSYSNPDIVRCVEEQLSSIDHPALIARLISLMEKPELHDRIKAVLKKIDHPDARQVFEKEDE